MSIEDKWGSSTYEKNNLMYKKWLPITINLKSMNDLIPFKRSLSYKSLKNCLHLLNFERFILHVYLYLQILGFQSYNNL